MQDKVSAVEKLWLPTISMVLKRKAGTKGWGPSIMLKDRAEG